MNRSKGPLSGIKVIELATYVAAPIVGRMCADAGAEVIKIESKGGDPWRYSSAGYTKTDFTENPLFDIYNAGKKCISLNIKTPDGAKIIMQMLEEADIFLTNVRAASLAKLGLGYDMLKEKFPRLIYATMTGYGDEGPDRKAPGFDSTSFWSRSGFSADMTFKSKGNYPVNSRFAMGDTASGTALYGGLMTALYQRERTGKGDFVTTSLYDAGIWMVGGCLVMAQEPYSHEFPDKRLSGIAMNLPYECADGEWIRCTIFEYERYAHKFYDVIGVTEEMVRLGVHDNQSMTDMAETLVPLYEKAFMKKTSEEWVTAFRNVDIVCGRLYHFTDVLKDEQAWANNYLQEYTCTNGAKRVITTSPIRIGSQGVPHAGKPMMYGGDNDEVLEALGYSRDAIRELKQKQVLA